jgi:hypothetical protein
MTSDPSQPTSPQVLSANPKNFVSLEHNTYPMSQGNLVKPVKKTIPEAKEHLEA